MPAQQVFFKGANNYVETKGYYNGLYGYREGSSSVSDRLEIEVTTGTTALPDIPAVAGTYTLIASNAISSGYDLTGFALMVNGTVAWTGGTAGTVSVTIQGTDGTVICTFTQAALTASGAPGSGTITSYSLSTGSTPATGVVDNYVRAIGQTLAKGVGIVAVVSNTPSAGSPLRLRLTGRAMP